MPGPGATLRSNAQPLDNLPYFSSGEGCLEYFIKT